VEIERRLVDVLSEFARTVATDFPIQAILDHLVQRIVEVLPIDGAGVTLISAGDEPHEVAASDPVALRYEHLQTELAEGPCVVAHGDGVAVAVPDLVADDRFPRFAREASAAGLAAVFTFPVRSGSQRLGALDLYCATPTSLDAPAMAAAQTLADVAAAYLLNARARAELVESSQRAEQASLHDDLTGLPNRVLLARRLERSLVRGRRADEMVGVLFVDLDEFKMINDTHGHQVGDELIVAVAERLTGVLRANDTLARVGGDEFVVVCGDLVALTQLEPVAERIGVALDEPLLLSIGPVSISASIGVVLSGLGEDDPETLLHAADMAMYRSKRAGGAQFTIIALPVSARTASPAAMRRAPMAAAVGGVPQSDHRVAPWWPATDRPASFGRFAGATASPVRSGPLVG